MQSLPDELHHVFFKKKKGVGQNRLLIIIPLVSKKTVGSFYGLNSRHRRDKRPHTRPQSLRSPLAFGFSTSLLYSSKTKIPIMASIFLAEATSFQSTGGQRVAEFAETLTLIFTLVCYVQNHAAFCLVTFFFVRSSKRGNEHWRLQCETF